MEFAMNAMTAALIATVLMTFARIGIMRPLARRGRIYNRNGDDGARAQR